MGWQMFWPFLQNIGHFEKIIWPPWFLMVRQLFGLLFRKIENFFKNRLALLVSIGLATVWATFK
jgi:hypothetical protein